MLSACRRFAENLKSVLVSLILSIWSLVCRKGCNINKDWFASNTNEHLIDSNAFATARIILEDFPELYADRDKALVAFKLFVRIKVGIKGVIRDVYHMQARQCPSNN